MNSPFELLGIRPTSDVDAIRRAYHVRAMKIHPDHIQDPGQQQAAQEQMVALNNAYEQALRIAGTDKAPYLQTLDCADAVAVARKLLRQQNPENALRQLMRAGSRNAEWFFAQGDVLMAMGQYESAHQSYREAVRRDPDNMNYRSGALDAAMAVKRAKTLGGRLANLFGRKKR